MCMMLTSFKSLDFSAAVSLMLVFFSVTDSTVFAGQWCGYK